MNIGNVQTTPSRQRTFYDRALKYFERIGDKHSTALAVINIGISLREQNKYEEAFEYHKRAYDLAKEIGDSYLLSHASLSIGTYYRSISDNIRAIAWYRRSVNHAEKSGNKLSLVDALVMMCRTFCCDHTLGVDPEMALEYGERAINTAKLIGDRKGLMNAYRALTTVHTNRGDYQSALQYHKLYAETRDSLYNQQNTAKINELSIRYETEKREREIRELQDQRHIQQLEIEKRKLESGQALQQARLLAQENSIKDLEIENRNRLLERNRIEAERRKKDIALLAGDRALQASVAERAAWQRNSAVGALLLLGALAFLGYHRTRERRRADTLRAEAAESAARAAEYKAAAAGNLSLAAQAQAERAEKEAQRALALRVMELQESERNRIATDLHDSLGHGLLVIKNSAYLAQRSTGMPEALREQIVLISDTAASVLQDVRKISHNLRPVHLDRTGLSEALRSSLQALSEATSVAFGGEIHEIDGLLDRTAEMNLFRIVQEGASNIVKHARATEAVVRVIRDGDSISVTIEDNGRGFDVREKGFGLSGMEDRVRLLGGDMTLATGGGEGTRIFIRLPLRVNGSGINKAAELAAARGARG